jgi:4-diphosphocytidyl-2C-methyl-D-erythritol kinase
LEVEAVTPQRLSLSLSILYDRPLPISQLLEWGADLGQMSLSSSWVENVWVSGLGAEVYPLEDSSKQYILLVVPSFPVSTAGAYCV